MFIIGLFLCGYGAEFSEEKNMAFYFLVDSYIYGECKEYEEYIEKVKTIVESYKRGSGLSK